MKTIKKPVVFMVLFVLSIPAILPLLQSGFIITDDGHWMIIRFSAFYQALADGQFPVRWLPRLNHSFGYPVANFLYPGFMYVGVPFKLIGLSFIDSVKAIFILSMVGSSVFCYVWLRHHVSHLAAFVGGLIYLYLPYHMYDLYQRGSVGELLALALVPFVLWQVKRRSFMFIALGVGFLILSHNTLALLFFPLILIYIFLQNDFRALKYWYGGSVLLGVLVAAFFWIPALYDLQYTVFFQTTVSQWSSYFADISLVGLSVILVFLSVPFLYLQKKKSVNRFPLFFFVFGLLSLFFSTHLSFFLWEFLPISFIQFPFRVLSVVLLSTAFISAWAIDRIDSKKLRFAYILFIVLLLFPSFLRIVNVEKSAVADETFATNEDTTTVQNEYMPVWVEETPVTRPDAVLLLGDKEYKGISRPTTDVNITVDVPQATEITYNQLYFPGWNVRVDGKDVDIDYASHNGNIVFPIEKGEHSVRIFFQETPVRFFADMISIVSLLLIIGLPVFLKSKKYEKHTKIL